MASTRAAGGVDDGGPLAGVDNDGGALDRVEDGLASTRGVVGDGDTAAAAVVDLVGVVQGEGGSPAAADDLSQGGSGVESGGVATFTWKLKLLNFDAERVSQISKHNLRFATLHKATRNTDFFRLAFSLCYQWFSSVLEELSSRICRRAITGSRQSRTNIFFRDTQWFFLSLISTGGRPKCRARGKRRPHSRASQTRCDTLRPKKAKKCLGGDLFPPPLFGSLVTLLPCERSFLPFLVYYSPGFLVFFSCRQRKKKKRRISVTSPLVNVLGEESAEKREEAFPSHDVV